jgi:hypothetical protein
MGCFCRLEASRTETFASRTTRSTFVLAAYIGEKRVVKRGGALKIIGAQCHVPDHDDLLLLYEKSSSGRTAEQKLRL